MPAAQRRLRTVAAVVLCLPLVVMATPQAAAQSVAVTRSQAVLRVSATTPVVDGRITSYEDPQGNNPADITVGPDDEQALWFTNNGNSGTNSIGRVTTDGVITHYADAMTAKALGIVAGPDGALWFVRTSGPGVPDGAVGRMTTAGAVTLYTAPHVCQPGAITVGPDGALWFTSNSGCGFTDAAVGRITTSGDVTTFPDSRVHPQGITTGPDGALWFTNYVSNGAGSIGRITTAGTISIFDNAAIHQPNGIVTGADGALWFVNDTTQPAGSIGRITTDGATSFSSDPGIQDVGGGYLGSAGDITVGPDGALWFVNIGSSGAPLYETNQVARMTTTGQVTDFSDPSSVPARELTAGPDGDIWFTWGAAGIGRLSPPPPEITADTAPTSLVFGDEVQTTGHLSLDGYGTAGAVVVQEQVAGTNQWTTVGSATASASGDYSLTWAPSRNGKVRARHPNESGLQRATSRAGGLTVAAQMHLKATHKSAGYGTRSVLSGTVRPVSPGLKVVLQLRRSGGWVTKKTVPVSSQHTFRVTVKPPRGTTVWRIYQAAAKYLAAGQAKVHLSRS